MYRDIVYTVSVYLLDVLEEPDTAQLLLDYYCMKIEVSVVRWGGGGGWWTKTFLSFFHYKFLFFEKCSWGPKTPKNENNLLSFLEGEILGVRHAPPPPLGVAVGRKTKHLFLDHDRRKFGNDPPC